MEGKSDSQDPLVLQDISLSPHASAEGSCSPESPYAYTGPAAVETTPSPTPATSVHELPHPQQSDDEVAAGNLSETTKKKAEDSEAPAFSKGESESAHSVDTISASIPDNVNVSMNSAAGRNCHSRGASSAASGIVSGKEYCHSRGASTDGSTMDAYTSSESRRGTYSEAGTLPVGAVLEGSTIIEENGSVWERISDKKLSRIEEKGSGLNLVSRLQKACACCWVIMRSQNALPPNPTTADRMKYAFSCPPHGKVGWIVTWLLIFLLVWGSLVSITGVTALPGGNIFSLLVLFVAAQIGGYLASLLQLPPLLGMLIMGIMLRSIPGVDIIGCSIKEEWSGSLRNIALSVILIRAGLGLDPDKLKKLSFMVLRLAMTPCLVETITVAIVSHFLLDFPWQWAFMLGFILAAVSPAVVVPCLLTLNEQGYGVDKGIPTLVIAAASIDDVLAISGFGVMLGVTFSKDSLTMKILQGPVELIVGIGYGVVVGMLWWIIPYHLEKNVSRLRFAVVLGSGLLSVFGSQKIGFGGAGALGCLTMAFVAGTRWRKPGWSSEENLVADYFNVSWKFFQPLLFGLIGTEIQVTELDGSTIGWGILTLLIGLTLRVLVSFFVTMGGDLSLKERFFVALAWLPKATVQAAIGPIALDYSRSIAAGEEYEALGKQVLTIAVLVILITAPIGAAAIMLSAPRLLKRTVSRNQSPDDPEASM